MIPNNDDEILKETRKYLQTIGELFAQTFTELLKEKQAQAAILIKLNRVVAEFKQFQEKLEKHGTIINARLTSFTAEIAIKDLNKIKLSLTDHDNKFLQSIKIVPPK